MSLPIAIVETISNILINIISNDLDFIKGNFILSLKVKCHNKKTKKWIDEYIKQNDETFFTTSTFERYLEYQKPIEKIHDYVFEIDSSSLDKDSFIYECIQECKEYFTTNQKSFTPKDEGLLKEFYHKTLNSFISFSNKQLSLADKRIIRENKLSNKQIIDKLDGGISTLTDIKDLLKDKQQITNSDILHSIYNHINKEIWNGEFESVFNLLPLIEGKSDDLENTIKIKLHLLSTYKCLCQDVITAFSNINDSYLRNDVARLFILHYFDDRETLSKIKYLINYNDLSEIIECIINENTNKFFHIKAKQQNNANIFEFKLENNFNDEQWLVKRICLLYLYKKPVINLYTLIKELVNNEKTYIDELILIQKETENVILTFGDSEKSKQEKLTEIAELLLQKQHKFEKSNEKAQIIYYDTLTKALALCDNKKLRSIHSNIPIDIQSNPKIEAINIYVKSLNNEINENNLVDFCVKNEEYWILNCYLTKITDENPNKFINFIESHLFILEKHPVFFFTYFSVIKRHKGSEKANELLQKYEYRYSNHLEYWIELYSLTTENKTNLIDTVFKKWKSNELSTISFYTEIDFIDILITEEKYHLALNVVTKLETLSLNSPDLLKRKANILNNLNRSIDAFQILLSIFDYYNDDLFVIGTILAIAVNYKREVPKKIIESAIKIGNSHLLMLVSIIFERDDKTEDAIKIATKSLLLAENEDEPIYGYYFGLLIRTNCNSAQQVSDANDDTAIILQGNGIQKTYCIHKNNILPKEQYICKDAIHIHRDTAIQMNLLRKKVNSKITIDGIEYVITKIMPLDFYLHKLCLNKLINRGDCKQFSIRTDANKKIAIDEFTTQIKKYVVSSESLNNLLYQYNDMTKLPNSLFTLSTLTKLSYEEFIFAFLQDNKIYIREFQPCEIAINEQFILSFSGLAILYKLDVPISSLLNKDIIITTSTMQEIKDADKIIIQENNKDNVASMGIVNEQLYFHTATEDEKSYFMQESTKFKKYAQNIKTQENKNDISFSSCNNTDLIEFFGICDYDSISIAKNCNRILVNPEPAVSYLSCIDECKFSTIGIIDFLVELGISINDMFDYMNKLIDFRFIVTLTEKSFDFIVRKYDEITDDDIKENILTRWIEYLSSAEEIEDDYKTYFSHNLSEVSRKVVKAPSDFEHLIYHYLFVYYIKYNNLKLKLGKDINGNLDVKLVCKDTDN